MAQPLELKISLRRGITGAGETTEAEVCLGFKLGKGDSDLAALVEEKFHEVKRALVMALDSEEPRTTASAVITNVETVEVEETKFESEVKRLEPVDEPSPRRSTDITDAVGEKTEVATVTIEEPSTNSVPDAAAVRQAPENEPLAAKAEERSERILLTPAQKRTIRSLCADLGLDDQQLRAMLQTGYNRHKLDDLGRREAGGLIFRLAQKQRERMLRDKPEYAAPADNRHIRKENYHLNGNGHPVA